MPRSFAAGRPILTKNPDQENLFTTAFTCPYGYDPMRSSASRRLFPERAEPEQVAAVVVVMSAGRTRHVEPQPRELLRDRLLGPSFADDHVFEPRRRISRLEHDVPVFLVHLLKSFRDLYVVVPPRASIIR